MSVLFTTLSGQKCSAVWLTTDHGLPQNSVKDMVKDRYGYLWISTERGIIRYDGNTFTEFNPSGLNNLHFMNFSGSREKDSIVVRNDGYHDAVLIRRRNALRILRYMKKKRVTGTEIFTGVMKNPIWENLLHPGFTRFVCAQVRIGSPGTGSFMNGQEGAPLKFR